MKVPVIECIGTSARTVLILPEHEVRSHILYGLWRAYECYFQILDPITFTWEQWKFCESDQHDDCDSHSFRQQHKKNKSMLIASVNMVQKQR